MPGRGGMQAYCRALAALPATGPEVAIAAGLTAHGASDMMRSFWALRLVTPIGIGYRDAAIWSRGEHVAVTKKISGKARPSAQHIVFASMIRALEDASTTKQLAQEVGVSHCAAQTAIRHMRAAGLVHLSEWCRGTDGRPVAKFEAGNGADVPKPTTQTRGQWARAQARAEKRMTYKAMCAMAGASCR